MQTDQGSWHAPTVVLAAGAATVRRVPGAGAAVPAGITSRHPGGLPQPRRAARRRRAGGRRLGQRGPDRRRAAPLRAAGHARRRRARPDAAHLPRPGHPVVDGRRRACSTSATTRSTTWCGRATCRRCSWSARRARDARPQRAAPARGAAGRPAGRDPGRGRAVLRLAAQRVRAGRPEAGPAAGHHRRLGRPSRLGGRRSGSRRPSVPRRAAAASTCGPARSARSSGRPATGPICPGSTSRCSTARAGSSTTAA